MAKSYTWTFVDVNGENDRPLTAESGALLLNVVFKRYFRFISLIGSANDKDGIQMQGEWLDKMGKVVLVQPQHFRPLTEAEESSLDDKPESKDKTVASTEAEDPVADEAVKPAESAEPVEPVEPVKSTVTEAVIVTETPKQKFRRRNNWRSGYLRMAVIKTIVTMDMWKSTDYGTRGKNRTGRHGHAEADL